MRINLLPSQANAIARDIWEGKLLPVTSDLEVIEALWQIADDAGGEIECFRGSDKVVFDHDQIAIALERGIEMRPRLKELDKMNVSENVKATDAQLYERAMVDIKAELARLTATVESGIDCELAKSRDVWIALRIVSLLKAINNSEMNATDKIIEKQRSAAELKESDL